MVSVHGTYPLYVDKCKPVNSGRNGSARPENTPNVGCAAGLDDNEREKAQHTQQYVSIFPVHYRSRMTADGVSRTKPELLPADKKKSSCAVIAHELFFI